ncbi:50S ribosomal protein L20 [Candidatus Microgenomates bacterium]|nr:50S ribosomal protein L20 [Candidatus Microgenomates bacterium]
MSRVKSITRKRHKKVLKAARGFRQARRTRFQTAREAVLHAGQYAYIGRKQKKRNIRTLWIERLNAAVREQGLSYSKFMSGLKKANINLNRQTLSQLAIREPETFSQIVEQIKAKI